MKTIQYSKFLAIKTPMKREKIRLEIISKPSMSWIL